MNPKSSKPHFEIGILILSFAIPCLARAQTGGAALSGTVTGPTGATVANARVAIKNVSTGQAAEVRTNANGVYSAPSLPPGNYEVTVSAEGFGSKVASLTVSVGAAQTRDFALTPASTNVAPPPTLGDLGFPTDETQGNAADQARLDRRAHMLKMHQRFGLITLAPMIATIFTSGGARGRHGTPGTAMGRDLHGALGAVTADMYFMTAYYAIRAPRIPGTTTRGPIRLHKFLAWIHGPGMILTPILGAMAYSQESQGERVHGIAKAHGAVATVTYAAFGLAVASVVFKF